jgi:hypothetical protein
MRSSSISDPERLDRISCAVIDVEPPWEPKELVGRQSVLKRWGSTQPSKKGRKCKGWGAIT